MQLNEITPEMMKKSMTDTDWNKIFEMSRDKNLYQNLINSLFPSIHGNDEVKKGLLPCSFNLSSKLIQSLSQEFSLCCSAAYRRKLRERISVVT